MPPSKGSGASLPVRIEDHPSYKVHPNTDKVLDGCNYYFREKRIPEEGLAGISSVPTFKQKSRRTVQVHASRGYLFGAVALEVEEKAQHLKKLGKGKYVLLSFVDDG